MRFFITGGSRGIGAQLVRSICGAGHDVAFTYLRQEETARRLEEEVRAAGGGRCTAYRLDVRDASAVEEVAERAVDGLGGVEVLVSNAGVSLASLLVSMSDEAWREVIDTNLTGAFNVCRQL